MRLRALLALAAIVVTVSATDVGAPARFKEVDVFTIGEAGYFCIKSPYLLTTAKGTLIAFAEARYNSCSDFTGTDLVFKRSTDNGTTWSPLRVMYGNTSIARNVSTVIGNAAPIQLRNSTNHRILVPFCRNNFEMYQTWSDDDGVTWAEPVFLPHATQPGWQYIGSGPPGGLQLASGKLLVPCYHSYWPHWTDGTDTRVHVLLNDDPMGDPTKWRVAGVAPGFQWSNECQAVELEPNHILIAARGLLFQRMQIESFDGGETLGFPYYVEMTQPLDGCEGSIALNRNANNTLFYSGTVNPNPERFNMTLWTSTTSGKSWELHTVINTGRTAYSSLVVMPDGLSMGLLYERSNATDFVFLPTQISFLVAWPHPTPALSIADP